MEAEDTHGLGYERVDADPNVAVLLATMDTTVGWEATRQLRAWERQQLSLHDGQRLLDVGCGLGDAALALAADLGVEGEVVGVDASRGDDAGARSRARATRCRMRFVVGDACALDEPDDSFDVVRSERTLQWLTSPEVAVAEMARVLRPGGLVSLVDTDWSTFKMTSVTRTSPHEFAKPCGPNEADHRTSGGGLRSSSRTSAANQRLRRRPPRTGVLGIPTVTSARGVLLDVEPRR